MSGQTSDGRAWREDILSRRAAGRLLVATAVGALLPQRAQAVPVAPATPTIPAPDAGSPLFRGNAARTGEMPGPGLSGPPTRRWRFALDGPVSSSPAVVAGRVFIGTSGGLVAINAATGAEDWRFASGDTAGSSWRSSPAVADGTVYVGAGTHLRALDALSGEERWHVPAGEAIGSASPAVVAGIVYAGAGRSGGGAPGDLLALDAASGRERWRLPGGGGSPTIADGIVYVNAGSAVVAVEAMTGTERWRIEPGGFLGETPAVVDDVIYVSGWYPSFVAAFEARTGAARWRLDLAEWILTSPAVAAGTVYHHGNEAGGAPVHLYAIDAVSGAVIWRVPTGSVADAASPAVAGEVVYASGGEHLFALETASGRERWRFPLVVTSAPVVVDGVVYVGGEDGLYAIGGA